MMELPAHPPAVPHTGGGGGGGGKNVNKRLDKMKPGSHVIMFNQSGVPTVVSSGGSGHVQHVSVVGHVQHVSVPYEGGIAVGGSEADELTAKKKASSFKITNVYLSRPPSNDGDDSCDDNEDLEDSHTEDLSDSLSQLETVAALNSGPTVVNGPGLAHAGPGHNTARAAQSSSDDPESVQFRKPSSVTSFRRQSTDKDWEGVYSHQGFGFVTYHNTGSTSYPVSYLDKAVSGAVAVFNSMECEAQMNHTSQPVLGPQDFKTKFKVVKVETTKPLNRGRWTCFDFTDKNTSSSSASEVSKSQAVTSSNTSANSKPTTKTSDLVTSSRPGSTLPRESAEPSSVITSDNVIGSNNVTSNDIVNHPVKSDQEQSDTVSSAAAATVTEDKEVETLGPPKVEVVRGSSAVPEAVPRQVTAAPAPPTAAAYPSPPATAAAAASTAPAPTSSSSNTAAAGLNISLSQQSVPVITPTPSQVQSPHTGGNMPDFNALQNTIGQVIRLNDGTLAQVALAPLPQQQQAVQVKLIPNSGSTNPGQQMTQTQVHQQQPQVMVNAQGQHFLVSQTQQQQNINQVPQQQSMLSQIQQQQQQPSGGQQQQPPAAAQQQQQPNRSQQQSIAGQQQSLVFSQQQSQPQQQPVSVAGVQQQQGVGVAAVAGGPAVNSVISNASALPMQQSQASVGTGSNVAINSINTGSVAAQQQQPASQQQQQQPVMVNVSQQQQTAVPPSTAAGQVSTAGPPTSKRSSTTGMSSGVSSAASVSAAAASVQSRPAGPVVTVCQNGVNTVNSINSVTSISTLAPSLASHQNYFNYGGAPPSSVQFSASGSLLVNPSLDSGYSAVNSVMGLGIDSEGLVERLEDLVSNQFGEEARESELSELESASGAGQGSIDHRIEQAMDLVKSHLMTAVRSEVEELRDKITKLEDTVNHLSRENEVLRSNVNPELTKLEDTVTHLSRENEVLRANVNPDVLASLLGNRSILGGLPPDPNSHPALQPPNQH